MKQRIISALDVGSKTLKLAAAKIGEDGTLELLGVAKEPSFGVRKGVVVRPEETAKRIATLVKRAEQMCSCEIEDVVISLGGSRLFAVPSHGLVAVSRADGHIAKEDINRVLQAAQTFSLSQNQEILEVYPTHYTVDGEHGIREPIGMKAVRLETDVVAVCMFSPDLKNLTEAVLQAGLEVVGVHPAPLAASSSVIGPEEKEMGVAVLDLGAQTASLAVYEEGDLKTIAVLPVGSENITHDIAIGLRVDHDSAERVKTEFGTLLAPKGKKMERIESEGGESLSFSSKFVSHIIEARVKEIFSLVQEELKKLGKQGQLPGGVVVCGGGALLPKIEEFAKKELKLPARIGTPRGFNTLEKDPSLVVAYGLLQGAAQEEEAESRRDARRQVSAAGGFIKRIFKLFIP